MGQTPSALDVAAGAVPRVWCRVEKGVPRHAATMDKAECAPNSRPPSCSLSLPLQMPRQQGCTSQPDRFAGPSLLHERGTRAHTHRPGCRRCGGRSGPRRRGRCWLGRLVPQLRAQRTDCRAAPGTGPAQKGRSATLPRGAARRRGDPLNAANTPLSGAPSSGARGPRGWAPARKAQDAWALPGCPSTIPIGTFARSAEPRPAEATDEAGSLRRQRQRARWPQERRCMCERAPTPGFGGYTLGPVAGLGPAARGLGLGSSWTGDLQHGNLGPSTPFARESMRHSRTPLSWPNDCPSCPQTRSVRVNPEFLHPLTEKELPSAGGKCRKVSVSLVDHTCLLEFLFFERNATCTTIPCTHPSAHGLRIIYDFHLPRYLHVRRMDEHIVHQTATSWKETHNNGQNKTCIPSKFTNKTRIPGDTP
eukprot:scaffold388_cov380-Prasinococcus_capsulatus_cf.AAC.39